MVSSLLFLFVTLWNYKVCENGKAMKHCNFENNHGAIASRKVCTCATIFKFFYGPPGFSLRRKLIPKYPSFRTVNAQFQSLNSKIWHKGGEPGTTPTHQFKKKLINGMYPFCGKFIPKILKFCKYEVMHMDLYFAIAVVQMMGGK